MQATRPPLPIRLAAISGIVLVLVSAGIGTVRGSVACIGSDGQVRLAELLHRHPVADHGVSVGSRSWQAKRSDHGQVCHGCIDVLIRSPFELSNGAPGALALPATRCETAPEPGAGTSAAWQLPAVERLQGQRTTVLRL